MANYKVNQALLEALSDEDCTCLELISRMRCLTESLAHRYVYSKNACKAALTKNRIGTLCSKKLLETIDYGQQEPALFLTTLGVEAVKHILWEQKAYGKLGTETRSAYELKLKKQNINHQMSLNAFVLELFTRLDGDGPYTYLDAKYMPPCSLGMMPDGMIDTGGRIYLLEMDMGNERTSHLSLKWNNYRAFLANPGDFYYGKEITMVFILGGVTVVSQRRNTVVSSLARMLIDKIGPGFEVYADAPARLCDILPDRMANSRQEAGIYGETFRLLQIRHGFIPVDAVFGEGFALPFDAYIRKLSPQNKIFVQNGRPQEFLLDVWEDGRLSVLHSILYFQNIVLDLRKRLTRGIPYLVVLPNEKWANNILAQGHARGVAGVYYTTVERLRKRAFPEAVFQIDEAGALYHFAEPSLSERVFERKFA